MEIRHLLFNPNMHTTRPHTILQQLLEVWEKEGWELDRVVPHHQYESIAVLVKEDEYHTHTPNEIVGIKASRDLFAFNTTTIMYKCVCGELWSTTLAGIWTKEELQL